MRRLFSARLEFEPEVIPLIFQNAKQAAEEAKKRLFLILEAHLFAEKMSENKMCLIRRNLFEKALF